MVGFPMFIDKYEPEARRLENLIEKISGKRNCYSCHIFSPDFLTITPPNLPITMPKRVRIRVYNDSEIAGFQQFNNVWQITKNESDVICRGGLESIALEFCLNYADKLV
jgi:hypothetical protein